MNEVYFTSDLHANHRGICRGESHWEDKSACRDFDTVEKMNSVIFDNINKTVGQDDILYILGDAFLGPKDDFYNLRSRINCVTIHYILGNHSEHIRKNSIIPCPTGYMNAQNLFTSVHEILDKKICGQNMVLCHYALKTWHKAHKGSWNLFGHSHGTLKDEGTFKQMDAGIDTHPEFRPYHFSEIKRIMDKRMPLNIDRHGTYN